MTGIGGDKEISAGFHRPGWIKGSAIQKYEMV